MEAKPEAVDAGHAKQVRLVPGSVNSVHAVHARAMRCEVLWDTKLVQQPRVIFIRKRLEDIGWAVV